MSLDLLRPLIDSFGLIVPFFYCPRMSFMTRHHINLITFNFTR